MQTIYLLPREVPTFLKGDYKGRKFRVVITLQVTIPADAGVWQGGSKDSYSVVRLEDGEYIPLNAVFPDKSETFQMNPGFIVVKHSYLLGKDMGLTFYIHPDTAAQGFLPKGEQNVTS